MWWWSSLLVGFLGSFHCVGMCGPIALALPRGRAASGRMLTGRLLYNAGRILTYSFLGFMAGGVGHVLATAGFQRTLSIFTGVLILTMALSSVMFREFSPESVLYRWTGVLKSMFRKLMGQGSRLSLLLIGVVNGLLPCGFVYLAVAAAATATAAINGALYMVLFGLGTVPAMLLVSMSGSWMGPSSRKYFVRLTPYVAAAVAVLLIYRGLFVVPASCCKSH